MNASHTVRFGRDSGCLVVPLSGRFAGSLCRRLLPVLLLTVQVQAQSVTIQDPSFDNRSLNAGSWSTTLTPWQETNGPGNSNGFVENISGFAADGANHLGMNLNHNVWQDLGVTYQANSRYTLTVAVGNRSNLTQSTNQSRYLLADSTGATYATGTHNASTLAVGTFADAPALVFETGSSSEAIGKTIRIRLEARGAGRSHFDHIRLTTAPMLPPTATTGAAGNLTDVAATLVGTVNANGAATTVSFAYGTSPSYGSTVTATPAPVTGTRNTTVTAAVSGLAPGTTYHYRVTATNSVGTTHGTDRTFTTETPAYLSALAVSEGVLSPAFAPTTISYWVQVPPATATIRLTAQTEDAGATIRVQGVELASGATTEPIALAAGGTQITVGVTAAGSTFAKNYVVTVTRPMESFVFTSASSTAITAPAFDATGLAMEPSLGYAPTPGTNLWLVNNTGLGFIQGEFAGLSQGQLVSLAHNGISYRFVANYFGGTGNDLVLEWAYGRLVGWGSNYDGMLGEGTTATRLQPVPVATDGALAGKTVVRVSLGGQHALALCSDGTLAAWGDGSYSQLGNGSNQDSYVPVAVNQAGVLAGKRVIAIAAGNYHNLVLCSDGTLAAWGWNNSSRLGNGAAVDSNVPVLVDRSGVLAGKTVVAIAAGGSHSLVLCADGTLAAWGSNYNGTLGNNSTTTSNVPVLVDQSGVLAGKTVTAISAGDSFNLVACSDGTAAAWGNNNQGQLGDGTQANRMVPVLVDRSSVLAGRSVTAVGARGYYDGYWGHALCSDGTIAAWGSNGSGQLGTGTTTASFLPTAVVKTGALSGRTPVAAFGGSSSSYALASDGVIAAWGYNVNGQLGNGTTTNSLVPVAVTGLGTDERFHFATAKSASVIARTALPPPPVVVTAAASAMQDTGAKLNGSVSAQGSTTAVTFEYGLTTAYGSTAASSPASVTGSATTAVSATLTGLVPGTTYHYRVTATSAGGRISGENQTFTTTDLARLTGISLSEGQLSPEFAASRTAYLATVPNTITGLTVTPVTADAGSTITVNGTAVESGTASGTIALAVGHTNLSVVVTAAGGVTTRTYTIAVTRLPASFTFASAGTVPVTAAGFATGGLPVTLGLGFAPNAGTTLTVVNNTATEPIRGEFSNLADGQRVEVSYSGISYPFIVDYFGGTGNDLVLRWGNNRLLAWGRNLNGQLGNNSLNNSNLPVAVDMSGVLLGKTVSAVAAGAQSGFALTTDGRVAAWGGGILGNNDWGDRTAPVAVSTDGALDGRRLRAFSGRHDHVLGLCTDGTVVAWGDNDYGKASGNAEVTNLIPTELAALGSLAGRRVIAVAAGAEHSLALCADGALGTWGYNGNGQLGNDQNSDNPVPQAAHLKGVLAGKTVVSAACGSQHTLALCADGTLAAWGYNGQGQLGDGTTTYRLVPVAVNRSGVLAGKTVTAIAAGWDFSLALCSDGTLASWGYGAYGQLGNGSNSTSSLPVLVTRTGVLSGKTVTQIACGQYHSLALCSDGAVAAWGANDTGGPLGNGSNSNSSVPVLVNTSALKTGERFVAVAAGGMHSLALVASPPPPAATTLAVSGITDTSAVLNGSVTANGMATSVTFEWGTTTAYGNTSTATPASVSGTTATAVSAALTGLETGTTYHYRVVATNASGTIYGANRTFTTSKSASLADLSLGAGVLLPDFSPSVISYNATVANSNDSITVTATAEQETSTLTVNGTATPSGSPSAPVSLSVGNNTLSVAVTPEGAAFSKTYTIQVIRLPLVAHFTSASTIPLTAAAFRAQGHSIGLALGHAPLVGASLTLVQNTGSRPIEGSFSNLPHGQVVKLDYGGTDYPFVANYAGGTGNDLVLEWGNRRLLAWGDNSNGQLGDGTFTDRLLPVAVVSNGVLDGRIPLVVAASRFSPQSGGQGGLVFAMCADGALASWGINPSGLLGREGETNVPGLVNASGVFTDRWPAMVQVGDNHAIALGGDGVIVAWGNNNSGQIGLPADWYVTYPPTAMEMIGVLAGKTPVALAAGGSHNLVLCSDGTLAAWGENDFGQLGDGTTTSSGRAVLVSRSGVLAGKTVTAIAAGESFSLALCSDGTLASWGRGYQGVLGNGSTVDRSVPVAVTRTGVLSGKTVTRIACSAFNSLVLCSDGTLAAWGANSAGQLGNGSTTESSSPVLVNRTGVLAGKTVTGIAAGSNHCMVSCADGAVAAWGSNYQGELGNNSTTNSSVPVLVSTAALASGERMIAAAAGHYNSYAIVAMPPAPTVTTLAASAIKDTGATLNASVDGEGRSTAVSFEYGPTPSYGYTIGATPPTVTGTVSAAAAAILTGLTPATTYHYRVVATSTGGTTRGASQTFTTTSQATLASLTTSEGAMQPAFQPGISRYALTVGNATASLTVRPVAAQAQASITVNGTAVASGENSQSLPLAVGNNALTIAVDAGAGNTLTYTLTVTRLPAIFNFASAATVPVTVEAFAINAQEASIALGFAPQPGTLLTLVNNTGASPILGAFQNLPQGRRIDLVHAGVSYPFVVDYFGGDSNDLVLRWGNTRMLAWGFNSAGQLGDLSLTNSNLPLAVDPTGVLAGKAVVALVAGTYHSLALCADGSLAAWGENGNGQLGNGSFNDSQVPVWADLEGELLEKRIIRVVAGGNHTLALCADGSLAGWGSNSDGQLGNGTLASSNPLPLLVNRSGVLAGKTITAIAAGTSFSLALCSDGTLAAWGDNSSGQLGDGTTEDRKLPVLVNRSGVLAGKTVTAISAGGSHSLALCSDGTLASWGYNGEGRLGNGETINSKLPVLVNRSGVLAGKTVTAIAAGAEHSLVMCSDGTLAAWGNNQNGQLGNGQQNYSANPNPVLVTRTGVLSGKTVTTILAGFATNLALCSDGTLATWGAGSSGQLGNGSNSTTATPVLVNAGALRADERPVQVAISNHALLLAASPPPAVITPLTVESVHDTGATPRAIINANGSVATLAIEYGTTTNYGSLISSTPATASGTSPVEATGAIGGLASGTTYHYRWVATSSAGTVRSANQTFTTTTHASLTGLAASAGTLNPSFDGRLTSYHLALPYATESLTLTPTTQDPAATVTVDGVASAPVALTVGNRTIDVVVTPPGGGFPKTYQVTVTRLPETFAFGGENEVPVTVGAFDASGHNAAFTLDFPPVTGASLTVVRNTGDGPITGTFTNLVQGQRVPLSHLGVNYEFVADYRGGDGNDLVLRWAHIRLLSWGSNSYGQLGNGSSGPSANPNPGGVVMHGVLAGKTPLGLAAGYLHSLASNSDGSLASWGINDAGQLGINSYSGSSSVPVAVLAGALADKTAIALAAGWNHSLVLCSDGTMSAWGGNSYGQLGRTDGLGSPIPKAIAQTGLLAGKRVTAIATRRYHNLALCSDGTLIGWGDNSYGQLGNGVSSSRSELTAVDRTGVLSGKSVTGIATGSNHSLALCSDGTLAAWGANDYGQLGNNSTTTSYRPMLVDRSGVLAGKTVTAIASGTTHNLVLCADGTLAAWGAGSSGQLGNGLTSYSSVPVLVNRSGVLAGKTVTRVQAGDGFSLVLCSDGTMAAWGSNNSGALGNGGTASSNVPVAVGTTGLAAGERVVAVAAGLGHSLALVAMPPPPSAATLAATSLLDAEATLNGRVEANGNSATVLFEYGPTTAYGFTAAAVPATVDGTTPTAVSARITGLSHGSTYHFRVVATSATGTVRGEDLVFATNSTAALANLVASTGSLSPAFSPLRTSYDLTVPHGVTSLSVTPTPADDHASIAVNGTPLAAGAASQSIPLDPGASSIQIAVTSADGASTLTYAVTVTRLPEVFSFASSSFVPVSAGGFSISGPATLELLHAPAPGAVLTLLRNTGGAPLGGRFDNLAHGATIFLSHDGITYPFRVNYIGGDGNDLVLEWANTRLLAWGANTYGQLGDGTLTTRLVPSAVDVSGALAGRPVLRGGCGEQHSAVLCADGSLLAWGDNQYRQLGTGGSTSSQTPVEVVRTGALSDKTIVDLSVGGYHGLVLCDDGTVYGWGANDGGQLGDGSTTHRSTPVAVQTGGVLAGRRVTAIAAGRTHNLALCDDGTVVSWGNNSNGQLGNGGTTASTVPVAVDQSGVLAGKRVTALAAGDGSSYALCSDGTVAAWGGNGNGQLGDNSTTTRLAPVLVQNSGVLAGKSVVSLAAGASHAVVLCSDGTLAAWGYNYSGQLGNGSMYSSSSVPVLVNRTGVLAGKTIRSVHASSARSFALCDDGTLAAWGNNASGALGNNSTSNVSTPVLVSTANLRAGERMIRPLNGSTAASNLVIVASPVPAIASTLAATGIGDHGAVLGGTVNANGQTTAVWFEYGATAAYGATTAASPATVSGAVPTAVGATLSNLVAGTSYHYRVVAESGGGIIRGADMTFTTTAHSSLAGLALSKGTLIPAFSATRLTYQAMVDHPTESVTLIAQAADAGATVTVNGTAMPAGGPGVPVALAIGENTVTVAVNEPVSDQTTAYTLTIFRLPEVFAFTSPGTVPLRIGSFAGGGNHARFALDFTPAAPVNLLVVDNTGDDPVASPFDNLPQGQRVELERGGLWYPFLVNYHGGDGNDLVLQWANTRLLGWGSNDTGNLGDATTVNRPVPSPVDPGESMTGKTILATATGNSHSLALCADGSLFAWGHNDYGQFGDGTTTDRLTPVPVPLTGALAGKTVVAISAGYSHSLALCADGSLCSWGSNEYGQLGAADFQYFSAVPVPVQQSGVLAGKRIAAIFAGGSFNLVRCTDGTLAAWGIGAQGQLGNGSTTHSNVPVLVDQGGVLAGKRVLAVAPGANHTLVLCSDGTLAAWGYNNSGQLGDGTTTFSKVPVLVNRSGVLAGKTVDRIAAGGSHNLVRCTDGTLASWGYGYYGQLGNGTSYGSSSSPVLVSSGALAGKTVTGIVAGDSHSFALGADGTLAGWGDNQSGAVGNNSYNNATTPVAASLAALQSGETLFKVVSGNSAGHSIAIIGSPLAPLAETLAATGVSDTTATLRGNASGNGSQASVSFEYGLDTNYGTTAAAMPATVSGNTATAVAAALTGLLPGTTYHFRTVASGAGGTVRGGDRTFTTGSASSLAGLVASQGTLTPAFSPTVFDYHLTVPAEAASILFTPTASDPAAAIRLDTTAVPSGTATAALPLSAGVNAFAITVTAATGPDTLTYRIAVVRLPELFDLPSPTSIPLTAPGLLANGREIQIKLSHAPATGASLMLVNNTGTAPISGTFANLPQGGAVGLPFGGVVYPFVANYYGGSGNDLVLQWANTWFTGWGYNQFGQTGDGGTASRLTPYEPKPTARPVIAVTCGELSNVLLGADGAGLTGNGVSWPNPPGVLAGRQVVMIATGLNHTLGLCSDGALGAWGVNGNGELGNGSTSGSSSPPVWVSREGVLAGRTITAISAGSTHSLALCSDGTVAAWGANTYGQLGNNSTTTATVPVLVDRTGVLAGKTVVAIAAGREHSLALCADGTLASWGGNSTSQLGDGTTTNSLRPVPVSRSGVLATRTATSIFAGGFHSGALCSDGSIATWGNNSSGQLGNGTTNNSSVPVLVTRSGVLSGKTVTAVDGAENGTLATCSDGTLASWGDNWYGQAGDGGDPYSGRTTPVLVSTSSLLSSQRFIRGYAGPDHRFALVAGPPQPLVATLAATAVRDAAAVLNASADANGSPTEVSFEYGPTTAYGATIQGNPAALLTNGPRAVSATLANLPPATTVHFRAVARNDGGVVYGADQTFTTSNLAALTDLTLTGGDLFPVFDSLTANYVATVPFSTNSAAITAVAADQAALVTIAGTTVVSGTASDPLPLAAGSNPFEVRVQTDGGANTRVYRVTVIRLPEAFEFRTADTPLLTGADFVATGTAPSFVLLFAPPAGTNLTVFNNTGGGAIRGRFSNLAQNQLVHLSFGGVAYPFFVDYAGGSGNDLVLRWANTRLMAWGNGDYGQLGDGTIQRRNSPVSVPFPGALAGKPVLQVVGSERSSLALFHDGTMATWGSGVTGWSSPVAFGPGPAFAGKTPVAVAMGFGHSLALCEDGTLGAWGSNTYGQLGDGTTTDRAKPVVINNMGALAGRRVVAIAAGGYHNLALCGDGAIVAWGNNASGQLGNGTTGATPATVPVLVNQTVALAGRRVIGIAAGGYHCLALSDDGMVFAWGSGADGRLGNGGEASVSSPVAVALSGVLAGGPVIAITAGTHHSLALRGDGSIFAWGRNSDGQLGNGATNHSFTPVSVLRTGPLAGRTVTAISAGEAFSLATCSDGTIAAWGSNFFGQFGNGNNTNSSAPVAASELGLLAGERFMLAATGLGASHVLAIVGMVPPPVATTLSAVAVADTRATLRGTVNAQGSATSVWFEYGLTTAFGSTVSASPSSASGTDAVTVEAPLQNLLSGTVYHFRTVAANQGVTVVGETRTFTTGNQSSLAELIPSAGTLQPGFSGPRLSYLLTLPFANDQVTLTPVCAQEGATVTVDGTPVASGSPSNPLPLALGETQVELVVTSADAATAQTYRVLIVRLPETLAFGSPDDGPLAVSHLAASGMAPPVLLDYPPQPGTRLVMVEVTGAEPISGRFANLAQGQEIYLTYNGTYYPFIVNYHGGDGNDLVLEWGNLRLLAWGTGELLGHGGTTSSSVPVPVAPDGVLLGRQVMSVSAGSQHTLALCSNGMIAAWGYNNNGQLGVTGMSSSKVPVRAGQGGALAGKRVISLAAGGAHSLALCDDGSIAAWGANSLGQLGNMQTAPGEPVAVGGVLTGQRVVAIAAGGSHSLALTADGRVAGWGFNSYGQLGIGSTTNAMTPAWVDRSGVLAGRRVVAIAAGVQHSLVLCSDGKLVTWGNNDSGQLGTNSTTPSLLPVLTRTGAFAGRTPVAIACGDAHNLVLCQDGSMVAWGENGSGQVGDNSTTDRTVPVAVSQSAALVGKTVVGIDAGVYHSLAICSDGSAVAWGSNTGGALGDGTTTSQSVPIAVTAGALQPGERWHAISAGGGFSVALAAGLPRAVAVTTAASHPLDTGATLHGSVIANGPETRISFEYGPTTAYGSRVDAVPATASGYGSVPASAVISGLLPGTTYHFRTLAANIHGTGSGEDRTFTTTLFGTLAGLVPSSGILSPAFDPIIRNYIMTVPFAVPSLTVTPTCSDAAAAVMVNGAAVASGAASGSISLAVGETTVTVGVTAADGVNAAEYVITVRRLPESLVFGSPDDRPLVAGRLQVAGDLPPVALGFTLSPGTCLTLVDMTGSEPLSGTFANLAQGQIVELDHAGGTYRFVADYRGGNGNDLVLRWHNSRILAWGSNNYGQLGNNSNADSRTPVATAMGGILAGKAVVQLGRGVGSYGNTFSLALCADGTLAAWGSSSAGALGAGSTTQSKVPLAVDQTGVLAGRRVVQIATGADSVLALCDDGTLVSWGHDGSGQLGNDSKNESRSTPVLVDRSGVLAGKTVVQVAAGNSHCLALCSDGSVAAWGNNSNGQLGNGYTYNSPLPVLTNLGAVPPDQRVVAVAAGHSHSLALCSDGALLAWGENRYGQLGVQTSGGSNTPVPVDRSGVLAGRTLVALAAGEYSTLVLATDGSMFAWGANWNGNLGNGTTTSSSVPVEVSRDGSLAGKTVKSVAVSGRNSFALASDGSLYAWGASALLGGATADSWVPAAFPTAALRADEVFMRMAPGGTDGHALAITALPLPTAATLAASQITGYRALVQGAVNARDNTTTVRFEYGLNESYGTTISATPDNLAGNAETVAGATLRGLLPTTTYHFRVVAECAGGVIRGEDRTFTTGPAGAPPVFSGYSAAAPYQTPATIGLRKLLSKASDPDGETVAVTAVGVTSTNGGTVALLADSIHYTPPNHFSGADTFSVVLTDEGGASTTGTVSVIVGQAPSAGSIGSNPPVLRVLPDGKVGISFQGIPGRAYTVQRSLRGLDDWETLATITADAAGRVAFTDESPPPGSAFYRLGLP